MAHKVRMPALSPTMTHGTLARWLVREGDVVRGGDVIAEIETDKATMEFEVADEGTVAKILVRDGTENVAINSLIAVLREENDTDLDVEAALVDNAGELPNALTDVEAEPEITSKGVSQSSESNTNAAVLSQTSAISSGGAEGTGRSARVSSSPLARRLAKSYGLDIAAIVGSGPRGRIVKADVEAAKNRGGPSAVSSVVGTASPASEAGSGALPSPMPVDLQSSGAAVSAASRLPGSYTKRPLDRMRRIIAARLQDSKQQIPHFYLSRDVELDALLALRKQINGLGGEGRSKVSINDLVIKAWALALSRIPDANVSFVDDSVLLHHSVDVSVAVAIDGGLVTPVVREADKLDVFAISAAMRDLAARAKERKLAPEEYTGGGTSISNLGMYGVREFAAIINPPQATLLAVGAGEQRAVVVDGELAIRTMMTLTLSVDHRVVDGALGAQALSELHNIITNPLNLLLPAQRR